MRRKKTTTHPNKPPVPSSGNLHRPGDTAPRLRPDRQMLGEAFASEALAGLNSQASEHHLNANLDDLKHRLQQRIAQQKNRRNKWVLPFGLQPYAIAASVGLVLVCAVVVLFNTKYWERTQAARQPESQAAERVASGPLAGNPPYEIKARPLPETPPPGAQQTAPALAAPQDTAANPSAGFLGPAAAVAKTDAGYKKPDSGAMTPPAPVREEALVAAANQPEARTAPEPDRKTAKKADEDTAPAPSRTASSKPAPVPPQPAQGTRAIRGRVVDAEDGLAIPGVLVTVRGTELTTRTDSKGEYAFTVPSDAELAFSFIGYTTYRIPVDQHATIDARLTPDVKSLGEVVVAAPSAAVTAPFEPARPVLGMASFIQQVAARIEAAQPDKTKAGTVRLAFTVQTDGRFSDVKALKSHCLECDEAAVKAVQEAAPWKPAQRKGSPVPYKVKVTVPFHTEKR